MIDEVDKIILSQLSKYARIPVTEIANHLHNTGYKITERAIRYRLKKLEEDRIIIGYSPIFNPSFISEKISKTILIRFKITKDISVLIDRLVKYVEESPFCLFSARMSGDFDWICHFIFDSIDQYELENDNFVHRFSELIGDYRSYDSKNIKSLPYAIFDEQELNERKWHVYKIINSLRKQENLNAKLQLTVESLVNYFEAEFARIWLLDNNKENLILKFSAGKYKNIDGEFSRVSVNSNKIGHIIRTNKPAISNDVLNDSRIKYPEWAKIEKLRSFVGYPLKHNGKPIGVLAMFSKMSLSPREFELLGIFAEHISKELSAFYDAKELLNIK